MRPVGVSKKGKKDRNFHSSNWLFAQTTHVDVAPEILHAGSCPGSSYIFQVSWKSVQGSRSCGGSKIALSHWQGQWLIQQLVLPYKPWYTLLVHGCTFIWYTTYLSFDAYSHLVPRAHSSSILIFSHKYWPTLLEKSACATLYVHTYLYILLSSILQYYDQRVWLPASA